MKNLLKFSLGILSIVLLFTNCSNETKSIGNAAKLDIHLNNGEKWIANAETSEGITHLKEITEELNQKKDPTLEEYNAYGERLNEVMNQIIDQCTMDGEAHEQLHIYLMPIFKYIKIIKGDNLENCKHGVKHLNDHLEKYDTYFTIEQ